MRNITYFIGSLILLFSISGCAAIGIPETTDPIEKLKWADNALRKGRHIPAEKLLTEAIPLLEQEKRWGLLGGAYNIYGRLEYRYPKGKDRNYYYAIMNFDKSLRYIEKCLNEKGLKKNDQFFSLYHQWATNSAFSLGELYRVNKNNTLSCYYFDKSVEYYNIQLKLKPDAKIPAVGFKSFEEAIEKNKDWSNCNSTQNKPTLSTIEEIIIKTQRDLFDGIHPKKILSDSEIKYYISHLSSNEVRERLSILKTIFKGQIRDNRVFVVINEILNNKNIQEKMSDVEADEISWLCKALASSGRREYKDTINKVYENTSDDKIKNYAKLSLNILENSAIRNEDILQQEQKWIK